MNPPHSDWYRERRARLLRACLGARDPRRQVRAVERLLAQAPGPRWGR